MKEALESIKQDIENGEFEGAEKALRKMEIIIEYYRLKYGDVKQAKDIIDVFDFYAKLTRFLLEKVKRGK